MNTDIKPSKPMTMEDLLNDVPENQHLEAFTPEEIAAAIPRIKIEGSEFVIPKKEETVKSVDCIIIHSKKIRGYFKSDNDKFPTCYSRDMIRPDITVEERQNPTCDNCRHNKFGSAEKGKGKRCGETIQIFLNLMEKGTINHRVMTLNARPKSFKNWENYGLDISADARAVKKNLICWITNIEIKIEKDKIGGKDVNYPTLVFNRFNKSKESAPLDSDGLLQVLRIRAGYIDLIQKQNIVNPADDVVNDTERETEAPREQKAEQSKATDKQKQDGKQVIDYSDIKVNEEAKKVEDY